MRDPAERLRDILEAIAAIERYQVEMSSRERLKGRVSKFRELEGKSHWKSEGNPVEAMNRFTGGGNE